MPLQRECAGNTLITLAQFFAGSKCGFEHTHQNLKRNCAELKCTLAPNPSYSTEEPEDDERSALLYNQTC